MSKSILSPLTSLDQVVASERKSKTDPGGKRAAKQVAGLDGNVNSIACEILRVAHELNGFCEMYNVPSDSRNFLNNYLIKGFIDNLHHSRVEFSKMQTIYNSLKGRVEKLQGKDPGIEKVFNLLTCCGSRGIYNVTHKDGLKVIRKAVVEVIGVKNVVNGGNFKKYGVICLKSKTPAKEVGVNVISAALLKSMHKLREALLDRNTGIFNIYEKTTTFVSKFTADIEKILTFPEGRMLGERLVQHNQKVSVMESDNNFFTASGKVVQLNYIPSYVFGYTEREVTSIQSPTMAVTFHELIHCLHCIENRAFSSAAIPLWFNEEELATIGDPRKKEVEPLTELGLMRNTAHLPRIYHIIPYTSFAQMGDFTKILEMAVSMNYKDDLIAFTKANVSDLYEANIDKVIFYLVERKLHADIYDLLFHDKILHRLATQRALVMQIKNLAQESSNLKLMQTLKLLSSHQKTDEELQKERRKKMRVEPALS